MDKRFFGLSVWVAVVFLAAAPVAVPVANAQFSVGAQVPPLFFPRFFASFAPIDWLVFETGGTLFLPGLELDLLGKFRFRQFSVGQTKFRPYVGAGGVFLYVSTTQGDISRWAFRSVLGAEIPLNITRLTLLIEVNLDIGVTYFGQGVGAGAGIALRYDF